MEEVVCNGICFPSMSYAFFHTMAVRIPLEKAAKKNREASVQTSKEEVPTSRQNINVFIDHHPSVFPSVLGPIPMQSIIQVFPTKLCSASPLREVYLKVPIYPSICFALHLQN